MTSRAAISADTDTKRENRVRAAFYRGTALTVENPAYVQALRGLAEELLRQDTGVGDSTVDALGIGDRKCAVEIRSKEAGVAAGVSEAQWLYDRAGLATSRGVNDGDFIAVGYVLLRADGDAKILLSLERVVVNLMQRMSGIATATHHLVEAVGQKSPNAHVVATRKTPWGLLDKRAVHLGGGGTHRLSLGDAILIKTNHLLLASGGSATGMEGAIQRAWENRKSAAFFEVEVTTTEEAILAACTLRDLQAADGSCPCILMLDNFSSAQAAAAVAALREHDLHDAVLIEASGNVAEASLAAYAAAGVDAISIGALTHSPCALDLSAKLIPEPRFTAVSEAAISLPFEARYSLPPVEVIDDSPAEIRAKQQRIFRLKEERNAVILAHNYQRDEVQEMADFVGDSLGLSQQAASTPADVIVFCGVHFMAETAAILCPDKTVLLPDLRAGCSLASTISADELRAWKSRYPGAVVVAYVNTSAEVKAESDYCCTSANAAKVVLSIPADRPILFVPDKFLAAAVAHQTGRPNIIPYPGYCHVHRTIRPDQVLRMMEEYPDIELLIHPECGCVSSCMARVADGTLPSERTFFLSTEGMMRHIGNSRAEEFAVGTEVGMLHRLRKMSPDKLFRPINPDAVCGFMKTITLDRVLRSLEILEPQIRVPQEIARRARLAIDRMLAIV